MKKIFYTLIFSMLVFVQMNAQGYKIEFKIKGVNNQDLILGHHKSSTDGLIPDDTVRTNSKGYAVFKGDEPLKEGMYFIFLPSKTYFDFIVGKDQTFYIENDTADLLNDMKVKGSDENEVFATYHQFLIDENKKITDLNAQYTSETDPDKKAELETQIKQVSQEFEDYFTETVTKYPDLFFSTFLKATRDVVIPKDITDRNKQYEYYKAHYFDNFDVGDTRLFYTPIYDNKIETYLDRVVAPMPDSLNAACDYILAKSKHDDELYQHNLIFLFNKYARSQLMIAENIYVHLADIYIEDATWSTDSFKNELRTKLVRKKNCLIGNQAKNLHMFVVPNDSLRIEDLRPALQEMKDKGLVIENDNSRTFDEKVPDLSELIGEYMSNFSVDDNLYNVDAKYTILWFMSPDCSHCIHETPLFYKEYVDELKQYDVVVWSVLLESNTDDWAKFTRTISKWYDFIEKHQMYDDGWKNVWNPFEKHRLYYDISSSPILYLLDKDKKILAKKIGYEQAADIIKQIEQADRD